MSSYKKTSILMPYLHGGYFCDIFFQKLFFYSFVITKFFLKIVNLLFFQQCFAVGVFKNTM